MSEKSTYFICYKDHMLIMRLGRKERGEERENGAKRERKMRN